MTKEQRQKTLDKRVKTKDMRIEFTAQDKARIAEMAELQYAQSGFNKSEFAKTMGLLSADMSHLLGRKWMANESLIGQQKWLRIARYVGYSTHAGREWKTAETEVYLYVTQQLRLLQEESVTGLLVDDAGIGKTHACKEYSRMNKTAFYIDGSVSYRKTQFIKALGRAVGVGDSGKLEDVLEDAIYALEGMEKPVIIIDEAGDLDNKAYLVIKRVINALDGACSFYMVGSDGLRTKIQRGLANKQLGYTELFSRFGKDFKSALPPLLQDKQEVLARMAAQIAEVNGLSNEQVKDVVVGMGKIKGYGDMRTAKRKILGIKKFAA